MASKPVELTAKQQNYTLSAKKKKTKKTFRYSLAQTFPRYWPQLTEEQSLVLQGLLHTARAKNLQWFAEKRSTDDGRPIHYGLQASIRKLKTGQIRLLILSADLKPRYVANQIILQALACNETIRILCVPNLDNIMQTILNFTCYAFVISSLADFTELDKWTENVISEQFPVPQMIRDHFAHRNMSRPIEVDKPQAKQTRLPEKPVKISHLYLSRDNCKAYERAFVPKNAINLKPIAIEIESLHKINSEFISLDGFECSSSQAQSFHKKSKKNHKTPLALYRDLTIHKIQNNPNKVKKIKCKKNKKN